MESNPLIFDSFASILHTLVMGTVGYLALVVIIRVAGKRTLTQMNAFDAIIAVTIGSAFGRALTATEVALVDALVAFALLAFLQRGVAWLKLRSKTARSVIDQQPTLLFYRGEFITEALEETGLDRHDLLEVARQNGVATLEAVEAMVLEPGGNVSVLEVDAATDRENSTLNEILSQD